MFVWFKDLRRKVVKWDQICDSSCVILNNISIDNVFSRSECSDNLIVTEHLMNRELLKICVKEFLYILEILLQDGSKALDRSSVWQLIILLLSSKRQSWLNSCKLYVNELLIVDVSVPISCWCDRCWDFNSCCVNSLPNLFKINSTSDLFDQYWSHSLCSKLLMNA